MTLLSTPGYRSKGAQIRIQARHLHTHVYCSTGHNTQTVESAYMVNNQFNNENIVCICSGVLFNYKEV
jgi:hypothetical protein